MNHLRSLSVSAFAIVTAAGIVACSSQTSDPFASHEVKSPIINGQLDSAHPSVVALLQQGAGDTGSACTATIIKTDVAKGVGYALTAAHCVEGLSGGTPKPSDFFVVEGQDYSDQTNAVVYTVTAFQKHPSYGGNAGDPYDFAMVKIAGVDATTKVTPHATKAVDALKLSQKVDVLGYGKTSDTDTMNTKRHIINKPIAELTSLLLGFDQANGGLCQGDSGGPVIANFGGKDYVVGVNSFVASNSGTCLQGGYSGRISAAQAWVDGYISGTGGTDTQTCDECAAAVTAGKGACVDEQQACGADAACVAYNDCLNACGASDTACATKCASSNAAGKPLFDTYISCIQTACKAPCSATCGFAFDSSMDGGAANKCFEGSCCAEGSACADDATCSSCFGASSPPAATCQKNAAFAALAGCIQTSCATEFGITPAKCGFTFDGSTDGGASNTCFENSCCAEGSACDGDETCTTCLTDANADGATCAANDAYKGLVQCLTDSCADEFGLGQGGAGGSGVGTGGKGGKGGSTSKGGSGGSSTGTAGTSGEDGPSGGTTGTGSGGTKNGGTGGTVTNGVAATNGTSSGDSGGCSTSTSTPAGTTAFGLLAAALVSLGARARRSRR